MSPVALVPASPVGRAARPTGSAPDSGSDPSDGFDAAVRSLEDAAGRAQAAHGAAHGPSTRSGATRPPAHERGVAEDGRHGTTPRRGEDREAAEAGEPSTPVVADPATPATAAPATVPADTATAPVGTPMTDPTTVPPADDPAPQVTPVVDPRAGAPTAPPSPEAGSGAPPGVEPGAATAVPRPGPLTEPAPTPVTDVDAVPGAGVPEDPATTTTGAAPAPTADDAAAAAPTASAPASSTTPTPLVPASTAAPTTAPTAPTTAATAAAPAAPPAVPAQLAAAVTPVVTQADGSHRVTVHLLPEGLGRVDVRVSVHGDEVRLLLASADPVTRELLRDGLPELRAQLEDAGLRAGRLDVQGGGAATSSWQGAAPENSGRDGATGDRPPPRPGPDRTDRGSPLAPLHGHPTGSDSRLDLRM